MMITFRTLLGDNSSSRLIGILLLTIVLLCLVIPSTCFLFNYSVDSSHLPLAVFITLLFFLVASKQKYSLYKRVLVTIGVLFFIFVPCLLMGQLNDYYFDGQWYHQRSISSLISGWNPVFEQLSDKDGYYTSLWNNHYAKGLEIISAVIGCCFGQIECGKGINLILLITAYCFVYDALSNLYIGCKREKILFFTLLFTISPVVCSQLFTFYNDFSIYFLILIVISELYRVYRTQLMDIQSTFVIVALVILALSIKFTFAFWLFVIFALFFILLIAEKEYKIVRKGILVSLVSMLLAVLISFNPYLTNVLDGHHILYPLMGEGKMDIMSDNTPKIFLHGSSITNIIGSLFSRPSHDTFLFWISSPAITIFIWMTLLIFSFFSCYFQLSKKLYSFGMFCFFGGLTYLSASSANSEIFAVYHTFNSLWLSDYRIGGFGLFFPEILILSVVIFITTAVKRRSIIPIVVLFSFIISLFVLPSGWWARYVPFFYLLPCVSVIMYNQYKIVTLWTRTLCLALVTLMMMNITILFCATFAHSVYYTQLENDCIEYIKENVPCHVNTNINYAFKFKLDLNKISYIETLDCDSSLNLLPEVYIGQQIQKEK